jgi:hypothetical protein
MFPVTLQPLKTAAALIRFDSMIRVFAEIYYRLAPLPRALE